MKTAWIHACIIGAIYFNFCRKAKDLYFTNDFKEIFEDVFVPFKYRYDHSEDKEDFIEMLKISEMGKRSSERVLRYEIY